ncbi:MAG TPA: globin [Acidimicrobiia bacterium]|nr:globin [Acidimicrobiia bacterium]
MVDRSVYDAVGGQPFFDALVERFAARVAGDPLLRSVYPDDLAPGMRALARFLAQYWGGPADYSAEKGHPRLRMRHAGFRITEQERDAWLAAMLAALDEADLDPEIDRAMRDYFVQGATWMINAAD